MMSSSSTNRPNRYVRMMRYAWPYRRGWAAIVIVTLLSSAFSVLTPWPMKVLVDNVLGSAPMPPAVGRVLAWLPFSGSAGGMIAWVVFSVLVIFGVNSIIDVVLTRLWIRIGQGMVYDLAAELFARIQRRSLLFHTRTPVGDSMARVAGDSWAVHNVVDTLLFAPLHAATTLALMLVLMLRMNVPLTLLSLLIAPLMSGIAVLLGKRIRDAAHAQRQIESQLQSHVQQTLSGIPVVQAFAQEDREHGRFVQFSSAYIRAMRRSALVGGIAGFGAGLVTTVGTAIVLLYGARQVLHGSLSVGSLLVFLAYLAALQKQLGAFTGIYAALQTTRAKLDRVCDVLETEPEVQQRAGAITLARPMGAVAFENIVFGHDPDRPVLHGISLHAQPGETIAIVGATGAGKTTLMGMLPRFFDPWSGRVTLDGHDLRDLGLAALRRAVAIVPQETFLFPTSVAENIAYGRPGATRAEVIRAAEAANAREFIERLPDGIDTIIGERGATLSGGERQRLSIARALLKDSPVLILDEPTSALDALTEQSILEALERLVDGRTTFIIAHRLSTIRRADRIAVLEHGRLVELGSHETLLRRGGLYARLHRMQSGDADVIEGEEAAAAAAAETA
jgi:ATP-binding cassette subfamily B protein/subfamily B ATP-binding cassette protein MsbA